MDTIDFIKKRIEFCRLVNQINQIRAQKKEAVKELNFEKAVILRDKEKALIIIIRAYANVHHLFN